MKNVLYLIIALLVGSHAFAQVTLAGSGLGVNAASGFSCTATQLSTANGTYTLDGQINGKDQFSSASMGVMPSNYFACYGGTLYSVGDNKYRIRWSGSAWELGFLGQSGPSTVNFIVISTLAGNTATPPCGPGFGGTIAGASCSQNCTASMTVSGSATICAGQSTTLTASGCSGTVTWNNGGGTGPTVSVSPASTTIYTATCSTAGVCTGTATVTVNQLPSPPTVSLASGSSAAICNGQTTTLNATGCTGTVTWSPGASTGTSLTVGVAGTYSATCTNANNCTSLASNGIAVTVSTVPSVTPPASTSLCTTNPITLNATGTTFQWQRNGTDITGATSSSYSATQVGTYQVFTTGAGRWTTQTSGTTQGLNGVYFVDNQNGWVVGNSGTILRTTNGGATWTTQTSGTTNALHSILFTSLTNGVAVGAGGTILKTTDGGTTWAAITSGTTATLRDIAFGSATAGLIVGQENQQFGNGVILRTTDEGSTWSSIATSNSAGQGFVSVSMTDASNAITLWSGGASPHRTFKSTDGGATWTSAQNLFGSTSVLTDLQLASSTVGFSVGGGGQVFKTTDGSTTWTNIVSGFPSVVVNNSSAFQFNGIAFPTTASGWVVGGSLSPGSSAYAYNTTDGGTTWSTQTLPSGTLSLYKTHFASVDYGWAVGASGTIVKYSTRLCGSNVVTLTAGTPALNLSGNAANGTQVATQTITSTQTVASGINATYQAGQSITLTPNFNAQNGSTFLARIQAGCN